MSTRTLLIGSLYIYKTIIVFIKNRATLSLTPLLNTGDAGIVVVTGRRLRGATWSWRCRQQLVSGLGAAFVQCIYSFDTVYRWEIVHSSRVLFTQFCFPCNYCFYNRFSFINYLIPSSSIFRRCGSNIIRRDIEYIDYVNKTNKNRHAYIRISSLRSGYVRGHAIQNPSKTDIKIRTCDYTYMSRSPGRVSTSWSNLRRFSYL